MSIDLVVHDSYLLNYEIVSEAITVELTSTPCEECILQGLYLKYNKKYFPVKMLLLMLPKCIIFLSTAETLYKETENPGGKFVK